MSYDNERFTSEWITLGDGSKHVIDLIHVVFVYSGSDIHEVAPRHAPRAGQSGGRLAPRAACSSHPLRACASALLPAHRAFSSPRRGPRQVRHKLTYRSIDASGDSYDARHDDKARPLLSAGTRAHKRTMTRGGGSRSRCRTTGWRRRRRTRARGSTSCSLPAAS